MLLLLPFNVNIMITFKLLNMNLFFFIVCLYLSFYFVFEPIFETFQQVLHVLRFQTIEGQSSLRY